MRNKIKKINRKLIFVLILEFRETEKKMLLCGRGMSERNKNFDVNATTSGYRRERRTIDRIQTNKKRFIFLVHFNDSNIFFKQGMLKYARRGHVSLLAACRVVTSILIFLVLGHITQIGEKI